MTRYTTYDEYLDAVDPDRERRRILAEGTPAEVAALIVREALDDAFGDRSQP